MGIFDRKTNESYLTVENGTFTDIVNILVPRNSLTEWDWDTGDSRPDKNFNKEKIKAGESLRKREEVRLIAKNSPFTMILYFADGTKDTFRLHQQAAVSSTPLNFQVGDNHHDLRAWRGNYRNIHVKVENTEAQKENQKAKILNKQGEEDIKIKKYDQAIKKLKEALIHGNEILTIRDIKDNLSNANYLRGEELQKEAEDFETNDDTKKAQEQYEKARAYFIEANKVKYTAKNEEAVNAINSKISGYTIFNDGLETEKEAYELYLKKMNAKVASDFKEVWEKYREALVKYEEAFEKFKEGVKNVKDWFGNHLTATKVQINDTKDLMVMIFKDALKHNVVLMHDKEEEDIDEDEEDITQEIIDGEAPMD